MNKIDQESSNSESWFRSKSFIVTCCFLAAIAFLIATGHSAHLLGALPYLLLLACPLMHIFMHGSHGHSHDHSDDSDNKNNKHSGGCH